MKATKTNNRYTYSIRTMQRWLRELKEKGLIEYRGSKKMKIANFTFIYKIFKRYILNV